MDYETCGNCDHCTYWSNSGVYICDITDECIELGDEACWNFEPM